MRSVPPRATAAPHTTTHLVAVRVRALGEQPRDGGPVALFRSVVELARLRRVGVAARLRLGRGLRRLGRLCTTTTTHASENRREMITHGGRTEVIRHSGVSCADASLSRDAMARNQEAARAQAGVTTMMDDTTRRLHDATRDCFLGSGPLSPLRPTPLCPLRPTPLCPLRPTPLCPLRPRRSAP